MKIVQGYLLFGIAGLGIGYALATAYLQWALSPNVGYTYLALNARALIDARPEMATHCAFIIGAPGVLGMIFAGMFVTEKLTEFGETHWQSKSELKKNGFHEAVGRGFLLAKVGKPKSNGAFITSTRYPHCMVIAPTGRGKGVGFVIPNLLTFKGSTVTLDVKGENFEKTANHRAQIGDTVIRFAPTDFEVETFKWNPLDRIAKIKDPYQRMFELQKMANLFLQTDSPSAESFLVGGRMAFVAGAILAIERKTPTIGHVFDIINGGSEEMNDQFALYGSETQDEEARVMWESLAKQNDRTLTSYISLLNTSGLDAWQNGRVKEVTSTSDFDFADIRRNPYSIYLTINTHDIQPNAGLIRLFFGDLIANLEHHEPDKEKEPWPVMIILDEFHKLGKMPVIAESITTLRSYGARLAIITQTIPKLDEIYGENERRSLEGGAGIKVFMTPSEELTISSLSEACGMTTKRSVTKSRQSGIMQTTNVSERTEEVPLLKEDDARRLDMSDIILVVDGDHPIRAKGIRYFEDKLLKPIFDTQMKSENAAQAQMIVHLKKRLEDKRKAEAKPRSEATPENAATNEDRKSESPEGEDAPSDKDEEINLLKKQLAAANTSIADMKIAQAEKIYEMAEVVEKLTNKLASGEPLETQGRVLENVVIATPKRRPKSDGLALSNPYQKSEEASG